MPAAPLPNRYRQSRKMLGRLTLTGLFLFFGLSQFALFMCSPAMKDSDFKTELIGEGIVSIVWTVVLFVAMWMGSNPARYICLGLMVLTIVFTIPDLSAALSRGVNLSIGIWLIYLYNLVAFAVLIYSPHIRALTRKRPSGG